MYCKVAIWEALSGTNGLTKQTPALIARHIRLHVYVSKKNPWDGIAKGDKIFERIRGVVERVKRMARQESMKSRLAPIRRL